MLTKSVTLSKERNLEKDDSPSKPSQETGSDSHSATRRLSKDELSIDAAVLPAGYSLRPAVEDDLMAVTALLRPLVEQRLLLRRTKAEMATLLQTGFVAEFEKELVGFSAVEIYSKKLSEIQCLAVAEAHRRHGIGGELIRHCVGLAKKRGVMEIMAISASENFLRELGFDYSLPHQKRALFYELRSREDVYRELEASGEDA